MRPLLVAAVAAFLAGASAQAYYPAGPGYAWTYDSGETQLFSSSREMGGRSVLTLVHYLNGEPISEDYLYYGDSGVLSYGAAAGGQLFTYDPPLLIYPPEPLTPGQRWSSTTRLPSFDLTLDSEVVGMRGVETAVGRFNAHLIRQTTLTSNGGRTVLDLYFVPGVGLVRFVTQDGLVVDLIERSF